MSKITPEQLEEVGRRTGRKRFGDVRPLLFPTEEAACEVFIGGNTWMPIPRGTDPRWG